MAPEVSCELASRWLSRAIDQEISHEEERALEQHLDMCPHCRGQRDSLFSETDRLERDLAGISDEIDQLLRNRMGDDVRAFAVDQIEPSISSGSRRRYRSSVAVFVAMLITIGFFLFWQEPPAARATVDFEWGPRGFESTVSGVMKSYEGSGVRTLGTDEMIRLPEGSEGWLQFPEGSLSRIGEFGRFQLRELEDEIEIELISGRAAFDVGPRGETPFRVLTPYARIVAFDSRFGVVHEEGCTILTVERGEVSVSRRHKESTPLIVGPESRLELRRRGLTLDSGPIAAERPEQVVEEVVEDVSDTAVDSAEPTGEERRSSPIDDQPAPERDRRPLDMPPGDG